MCNILGGQKILAFDWNHGFVRAADSFVSGTTDRDFLVVMLTVIELFSFIGDVSNREKSVTDAQSCDPDVQSEPEESSTSLPSSTSESGLPTSVVSVAATEPLVVKSNHRHCARRRYVYCTWNFCFVNAFISLLIGWRR